MPTTPPPVPFLPPAGGWLAQERGIINFLEWQTLVEQRAFLSHPPLGVPQLTSLPVILCLYIFCFFSTQTFIHWFHTVDAKSGVRDRMHELASVQFQHCDCVLQLCVWCSCAQFVFHVCMCVCGCGYLNVLSLYRACQEFLLLPPVRHVLLSSLWCNALSH